MHKEILLHARHEHGGFPIHVIPNPTGKSSHFRVDWPEGPVEYPSTRQLLIALYNRGNTGPGARDPGMSFDRYFRRGKYAPKMKPQEGVTVFDLFLADKGTLTPEPPKDIPGIRRRKGSRPPRPRRNRNRALAVSVLSLFAAPDPPLSVKPPTHKVVEASLSVSPTLGIDLEKRGHEVRKLLFAGFGHKIFRAGYDPEDVLQEVYRGILARNRGKCPFDPKKSSFGHYVHMVCSCVLSNYHRKQSRRREFEQVGMYHPLAEDGYVDAAEAAVDLDTKDLGPETNVGQDKAIASLQEHILAYGEGSPLATLAADVVPMVFVGMSRSEIAKHKGLPPAKIGRALAFIRTASEDWAKAHDLAV